MKKDFLTLEDFTSEELDGMVKLAGQMKANPKNYRESLSGKALGMIFNKKSTRTRLSFEVGIIQLGGTGIFISIQDTQAARGETLSDTAKVLSRYLDGIMIRTYEHDDAIELAAHATIPVINGLTDYNHPCQALADMMTIKEKLGETKGKKMAYVGDGNNMALSLMCACVKFDMDISIISPENHALAPGILPNIEREAQEKNLKIQLTANTEEGLAGAHIVYTDVWASMGQEDEAEKRALDFVGYSVDERIMSMADKDAIFMHCLPAHRGEEVSAEVIDGGASVVFDQAENRLHAQKAIMHQLMR